MRLRPPSALLITLVAGALAATLVPTVTSAAEPGTSEQKVVSSRPYVTGWLPYWMPDTATNSVVANADTFDDASPFVFDVQSATNIGLQISAAQWQTMRTRLRDAGVDIIPTMSTSLSADQFASLLSSRTRRTAHVDALVKLATRYDVDGLDLDYESINFGSSAAKQTVRTMYPVLVKELQARLAAKGMILSVTVASRTSVSDPNWFVYDYAALGAVADRIRIMTYDFHWSGGTPGPIAPKWWINKVLTFAVTQIDPSKISFGLPSYGRDWYAGTVSGNCPSVARNTISRSSRDMRAFAAARGIVPRWSERGTSRTFTYVQKYSVSGVTCRAKREVWFDDARSVAEKLPLVETHQIRGVAMWALGYETPLMWDKLREYGQAIAPRRPVLAVTAPDTVVYGRSGVVRAAVHSDGVAVSGKRVTLQRMGNGSTEWVDTQTAKTGQDGTVEFDVAPRTHVKWRVRTDKDWSLSASWSDPAQTQVAYHVTIHDPADALPRNTRWTLSGAVAPVAPGTTVVRQKRVGGAWVTKAQGKVNKQGNFSFDLRSRVKGTKQFRVIALPGDWARGVSRTIQVDIG
ncbi:MAG TPA: glycosyl hydrolase family 18 protein [Actinomycetes bacterium]|nr:glycosyl hydrolase family 18 protein [Actinomycetes bacterium]